MRKNAKGFTLIELLAVIVILAIIALITVPTVLNIIDKAKKGAAIDSAYGVKKSADLYYLQNFGSTTWTGYNCDFNEANCDELDLGGTKPSAGTVSINATGDVTISDLKINGYDLTFNSATGEFTVGNS